MVQVWCMAASSCVATRPVNPGQGDLHVTAQNLLTCVLVALLGTCLILSLR